ncbi:TetR family transcriptional regulator [Streptomyces albireticuli]|uniref:TetR family transcriptional regulator n=1 Tax=Streptomyces albireticuli TaxID=1940 RepID=A0A1Z2KVT9_9ACTN|nr:TetR/AcrR family transcriptional regulator C-terminal domain-containing protein [Streptomyces albireticuli]ARZ66163.1 TetR family transcriptional regulator [Streptomyces albireticuli]
MSDERDEWAETVRILWEPPVKPRRGPKPALNLDRIARAAIEIADAEGLAALSMQRLAELIGFTKMSLYRYVPGRAELVALMVDTAIGEAPAEDTGQDGWRERLGAWSHRLVAVFQEHPWLLDATIGTRVMGPRELGWMERALAALDGTGLSGAERMDAVVLLTSHVRGIAQQSRAAGPAGGPEKQLAAVLGRLMDEHGERYPALGAALASAAAPGEQDQALEFGLQRILDGLEALIARRAG